MTRDASAPIAAGGCLTDRTIMPALPSQCPTTAAELILRHARSPRTKVVALTRNDTCEAQRAAMEYARRWHGKGISETEIGHGEISSATQGCKRGPTMYQ
jgi:hypothetical protein